MSAKFPGMVQGNRILAYSLLGKANPDSNGLIHELQHGFREWSSYESQSISPYQHSLIKVFVVCTKKPWVLLAILGAQSENFDQTGQMPVSLGALVILSDLSSPGPDVNICIILISFSKKQGFIYTCIYSLTQLLTFLTKKIQKSKSGKNDQTGTQVRFCRAPAQ